MLSRVTLAISWFSLGSVMIAPLTAGVCLAEIHRPILRQKAGIVPLMLVLKRFGPKPWIESYST
jgi:hypothetical protein